LTDDALHQIHSNEIDYTKYTATRFVFLTLCNFPVHITIIA
jgi:hypothetical protein